MSRSTWYPSWAVAWGESWKLTQVWDAEPEEPGTDWSSASEDGDTWIEQAPQGNAWARQ